ncbi:MAG: FtsX-like permease family protein [Thermodesulfobacteriota bacterium]
MSLLYLVLRGLKERQFRSLLIAFFILVLTGFLLATTVILWGMEENLRIGMERLGADIVVIPFDVTEQAQEEVLAGMLPAKDSMPADHVRRILEMKAVKRASPQLYLSTIKGSPYSSADELRIVAFDPKTDFTILPWLKYKLPKPLGIRDAIGGALINKIDPPEHILANGYELALVGKLEPTGIWFDQTVFVTFETARDMIANGPIAGDVSADTVTRIAVDLKPGYDAARTATEMLLVAPGIWPVQATKVMTTLAVQRAGLIQSLLLALSIIWIFTVVLTGFVFSLIVNEQRREIGMFRAVGASRHFIFRLFLTEGAILASVGGLTGMIVTTFLLYFLRTWLMSAFEVRIYLPSLPGLVVSMIGCFLIALLLVLPALLYPAIRASRLDPAVAMREV